jgi:hypothetical protein
MKKLLKNLYLNFKRYALIDDDDHRVLIDLIQRLLEYEPEKRQFKKSRKLLLTLY